MRQRGQVQLAQQAMRQLRRGPTRAPLEKDAPLAPAVDQVHRERRRVVREHQPRKAGPRPEVDPSPGEGEALESATAVVKVHVDGPGTDQVHRVPPAEQQPAVGILKAGHAGSPRAL